MVAGELVASELTVAIIFSAVTALVVAITALVAAFLVAAAHSGSDVTGDVQRFSELSAEADDLLSHGPLLSDPTGETTAAVNELLARREQARQALWGSRS
jgi:hypothetical protein